jgi:hypothetical protein
MSCLRRRGVPAIVAAGFLAVCLLCPWTAGAQDDARVVSALNAAGAIRGEWRLAGNNSVITVVCDTIRRHANPNLLCFGYLTVDDLPEYSRGDIVFWVQNSQPAGVRSFRDDRGNVVEEYVSGFPLADFFWGQECKPGYRGSIDTYSMEHLRRGKYPARSASVTIRLQGNRLLYESRWQTASGPQTQVLTFDRHYGQRK